MAIPDKSKYTNRTLHSDIEARGFLDIVHKAEHVWCICSRDDETDEVFLFHDYPEYDNKVVVDDGVEHTIPPRTGTLIEGVRFWYLAGKNGSKLSVHNCQTYDRLLVEKIWDKCLIPETAWVDTFIQSKVQWFDRPQKKGSKSPHGLLNYSLMQGHKKPPVEDFTVMNAFMLHRCIVDTKTQKYCYRYLKEEASKLSTLGIDFTEALKIENEYAINCAKQELRGVKVDVPHIKRCIAEWDKRTEELAARIEPLLPPTVSTTGAKVPRSELMKALGYKEGKIPPDEMETVTRAGETKIQPVKPYVKPSVNFHRTIKTNMYSGFNISYGESPSYSKKKLLTDWIKKNHPDTKSKEWDIQKEEQEAKVLNKGACEYFGVSPEDTDIVVGAHTRVSFSPSKLTQHDVVKRYLIRYAGLKRVEEWNFKKDKDGQMVRAEESMVVSYPPKAAPEHQLHYRVKKREPIVTSPKLGEKDYEQLTGDIGKEIGEYNTTMHRRRFLSNPKDPDNKGILSYVREDERIPAGVNNFGTSTSRASHRVWVNAAGEGALLGEDIRKVIIAEEGYKLVGADMKSAQLAIAAYYANNYEYYGAVASGQEVVKDETGKEIYVGMSAHCHSARNFGLVSQEEFKKAVETQEEDLLHSIALRRKGSKGGSFGVIFGCSGKKLAGMIGVPEYEGEEKKNNFLAQMGLHDVAETLKNYKRKYKRGNGWYIPLPFGYWVFCKSDHKSINYIIQGTEAACQKIAVNYFEQKIKEKGLVDKCWKVLDYHDEFLCEALDGYEEETGKLMCDAYEYASNLCYEWHLQNLSLFPNTQKVSFPFNLDGGYKVSDLGREGTYLQTH